MVYFTSDLHIGHNNIHKYRDEKFSTAEEHHQYMIDKILSLPKRAVLKILGDFLFESKDLDKHIESLNKAQCRIQLIMGNHDTLKLYKGILPNVEILNPLTSYKNMWLSHCPIHPDEMRGRIGCVHGHLHKEHILYNMGGEYDPDFVKDSQYCNVNIDVNNYNFVTLDEIKEYFKGST